MASRTLLNHAAAVSLALTVMAGSAQAQLTSAAPPNCTDGSALTIMGALACSGAWTGNFDNQQADVLSQLVSDFSGMTGPGSFWSYIGSSADANNGPFTNDPGTSTGTLNFDTNQTGFFALALKSGNQFSLYLFDGGVGGVGSIDFTTIGTNTTITGGPSPKTLPQNLSHAGLFRFSAPLSTPEPSTYVLTLSGIAGLVMLRRRRSA